MAIVPARDANVRAAGALIRAGGLVAFPTETVYGLGADATQGEAVARIFAAKGRPRFNPLIVHVAHFEQADSLADLSGMARDLAQRFWPGPLSLVIPQRAGSGLSDLVTAGLDTVALRMPAHPVALGLIAASQRPLAAPSANRSGHVSPTCAAHVEGDLGDKVAMILDGGDTRHGLESTVVRVLDRQIMLLRAGAITAAQLTEATGKPVVRALEGGNAPSSPGQLASHYAPRARVRINVTAPEPGEALIAFGPSVPRHDGPVDNLSAKGDLIEAAARLFGALRRLDQSGAPGIAVMPIPSDGLGEAINDRLRRAAAPRSS